MIRREFIRLASLTAGVLPFTNLKECSASSTALSESINKVSEKDALLGNTAETGLYDLFQQPTKQYRPMVRWWWNGNRVVEKEVLRELDVLQAAGIGGVEINPIRFPAEVVPMNTRELTWMSDEWLDVLGVALQGTKERGMTCDMIVGSGWPYGGEFLSREDQTQMVALGTKPFTGPAHVQLAREELLEAVSPHFVSPYKDSLKELFGLTLVPSRLNTAATSQRMDNQRTMISSSLTFRLAIISYIFL